MGVRQPLALLNELSYPYVTEFTNLDSICDAIVELSGVVRSARGFRSDIALVTEHGLGSLVVSDEGLTLASLASMKTGRVLEHWRAIQTARNVAPIAAAVDLALVEGDEDYEIDGCRAQGLGAAAKNGQYAVSFLGTPWDRPLLEVSRVWLAETEKDGEILTHSESVELRHASRSAHVAAHSDWLRELSVFDPCTGGDLWSERGHLYPHLKFLPRVEDQLVGLLGSHLVQVHGRLSELERAVAEWDPRACAAPAWRSGVTPEGSGRRALCDFLDLDGVVRCFEMHARYTPGAGRLHFRVVGEGPAGHLVVAYIGRKLGT